MDRAWWNEYADELEDFAGECWTSNVEAARIYRLNHIRATVGNGVPRHGGSITLGTGPNSGYQAVGLAVHFGARRVILLGYDMRNDGKRTHWHGDHARLGNPIAEKFAGWCAGFEALKRDVGARCEIVNASRETALRTFPRVSLSDAIDDAVTSG